MSLRLLLVDDDPSILALLAIALEADGYDLRYAANGASAIAEFVAHGADLVLLDVRMPGMDGFAVLAKLRELAAGAFVPVVLMTAGSEPEVQMRGLDAGADEFLVKPIDLSVLRARVRSLLRLKDARDTLVARNEQLERLRESQREFATFVIHDLRNPLAVTDANVEWVRAQLADEGRTDLVEALAEARVAVARQRTLIGDLLTVAQLEEGRAHVRRDEVFLADVLAAVERAHAREATERGLAFTTVLDARTVVRGDATLLYRLVENLVENAMRYTPRDGAIELACRVGDDGGVALSVSNTGRAIPVEQRARIFGRFQRGDVVVASQPGHFGLGLHFCRRVAEAHDADISVVDRDGWAVTFRMVFPRLKR